MAEKILFEDRPIAFTDTEATGLESFRVVPKSFRGELLETWHEICEIGLVLVDPKTLEIIVKRNWKIKINHHERITSEAQEVNGFSEEEWKDAVPLEQALKEYVELTRDAVFAAHNVTFDWGMISVALASLGIKSEMDYHRIDTWSWAIAILNSKGYFLPSYNLSKLCEFLKLGEEPMPHRAINGAMKAYEVFKALRSLPVAKPPEDQPVHRCC